VSFIIFIKESKNIFNISSMYDIFLNCIYNENNTSCIRIILKYYIFNVYINFKNCMYVLESMFESKYLENSFRDHRSSLCQIKFYLRDTNSYEIFAL